MKKLILLLVLFYSVNLLSQTPEWKFYSEPRVVYDFAEEGDNIWVCSPIGAMKFDKNTGMKTFYDKINSPLPDSWISQIVIDNSGAKWMGTWMKGCLINYNDTDWTIYDSSNSPLTDGSISSLAVDENNIVWLGTGSISGGMFKFDGINWSVYKTSNSGIQSNYIKDILCMGNNTWVATNLGLTLFDGNNWTNYNSSNSNFSGDAILSMEEDSNGNIWLLHYDGIEKFDGNSFYIFNGSNTNIPTANINSMAIDANDLIWIGYGSYTVPQVIGGIMSFDGNAWVKYDTANSQIMDTDIYSIIVDNSNTIWFGCSNQGLIGAKNGNSWTTLDPSTACLDQGKVRKIVHDSYGNAYIGSFPKNPNDFGLFKFDMESWTGLHNYTYLTYCMEPDLIGNIYIKDPEGLKKFDGTNWFDVPNVPALTSTFPVQLTLNSLNLDITGEIWMDCIDWVESFYDPTNGQWYYQLHEGLAHFNGTNWVTYGSSNSPFPDAEIYVIKTDENEHAWVGTDKGLINFDGNNWTIYDVSNSLLPSNYIHSFEIDTSGNIWLSDGEYGLYLFDKIEIIHYPHPNLNQYGSFSTLALDIDGSIWQNTGSHLIGFDGTNWTTFNADNSPLPNSSGLSSLSIDKFGNKWIGTSYGFLMYKKDGLITSLETRQNQLNTTLSVFPNPANDYLKISTSGYSISEVSFYTINGQIALTTKSPNKTIDISYLKPGLYFVEIKTSEGDVMKKIIVQ